MKGSCGFDEVARLTQFAKHGVYDCQMRWIDKQMESLMMENECDDGGRVGYKNSSITDKGILDAIEMLVIYSPQTTIVLSIRAHYPKLLAIQSKSSHILNCCKITNTKRSPCIFIDDFIVRPQIGAASIMATSDTNQLPAIFRGIIFNLHFQR